MGRTTRNGRDMLAITASRSMQLDLREVGGGVAMDIDMRIYEIIILSLHFYFTIVNQSLQLTRGFFF